METSGEPDVRLRATWGMSVITAAEMMVAKRASQPTFLPIVSPLGCKIRSPPIYYYFKRF
jgi:hypothetical protein